MSELAEAIIQGSTPEQVAAREALRTTHAETEVWVPDPLAAAEVEAVKRLGLPRGDLLAECCRTCGFSDCPGAQKGSCPRWPER